VDSQYYGAELFPLHGALQIESTRKLFVCTLFNLPSGTARNLTYALFPVMPALFMLLKRRASFYKRAQTHDLACVREAFLFDLCHLYPDKRSWCFQLEQMLKMIGVDLQGNISSFPRHLTDFDETVTDPNRVCFWCIKHSEEKTLSFFRLMNDVDAAISFRAFLSTRSCKEQDFLLLFLTSGFRWRFFAAAGRGSSCPLCHVPFWSWEHFCSCPMCPVRFSVPEMTALVTLTLWDEIAKHVVSVILTWLSCFDPSELALTTADLCDLFA
jgi:hypothetical protein